MDTGLQRSITAHLDNTVDNVLLRVREKANLFYGSEIASTGNGTASPFAKMLFPQIKLLSMVERSYSASIGTTYNYIARDLTRHAYGNGELEYKVEGELPVSVLALIDSIVDNYRGTGHASPDTPAELRRIRAAIAAASPGEERRTKSFKSDVFFVDDKRVENFIEIKTPQPNYDTCKAIKTRILTVHALRHPSRVNARVAFPHNPNGILGDYAWPPSRYWLDAKVDWAVNGVPLMGAGLWNYLGNSPDTFADILGCCAEVFERRGAEVTAELDAVVFGAEAL